MEDPAYHTPNGAQNPAPLSPKRPRFAGCLLGMGGGCFISMLLVMMVPLLMFYTLCRQFTTAPAQMAAIASGEAPSPSRMAEQGKIPVARLELRGAITGEWMSAWYNDPTCDAAVLEQITRLTDEPDVKALLLVVNSPGGSVTASDNLYHALECFKHAQEGRKIMVMGGDIVASGAYYLAMQADWIRVQPTSVVGSIGVIIPGVNLSGLAQRIGIADNSIASGDSKDIGNPLKPVNPQHNAMLKTVVNGMYERFIGLVANGRKMQLEDVRKLADGRLYTAADARNLRLVDDIGYEDTVEEKLAELLACEADALHLFSPEATDNTLATFFKFFPQAIGKSLAEALTPAGNQMPQYRW